MFELHPLTQSTWHAWMTDQIDDGSIDFVIDKSMPKPIKRMVKQVIEEVQDLIDTPVTFKQRKPKHWKVDKNGGTTDIYVTEKDPGDWTWDPAGIDPLTGYENRRGLAFISEGVAVASWNSSMIYWAESFTTKKGRIKQRIRTTHMTEHVVTHEILHTLGLSHPDGDGKNPGFDYASTAMSYNFANFDGSHIRDLDAEALRLIWGPNSLTHHSVATVDTPADPALDLYQFTSEQPLCSLSL